MTDDVLKVWFVDRSDNYIQVWCHVDLERAIPTDIPYFPPPTEKQKAEAAVLRANARWDMGVPTWIDKATGLPRCRPHPTATAILIDENTALVNFIVTGDMAAEPGFPLAEVATRNVARHLLNAGIALELTVEDVAPIVAACRPKA